MTDWNRVIMMDMSRGVDPVTAFNREQDDEARVYRIWRGARRAVEDMDAADPDKAKSPLRSCALAAGRQPSTWRPAASASRWD